MLRVPLDKPGLGIELNREAMKRYGVKPLEAFGCTGTADDVKAE